jgi:hypothetical protein
MYSHGASVLKTRSNSRSSDRCRGEPKNGREISEVSVAVIIAGLAVHQTSAEALKPRGNVLGQKGWK